jgi:hypothetical protein
MKYKGQKIKGKNEEIIPIFRKEGNIIFVAKSVQNWERFENLVEEPQPPTITKPGGVKVEDRNSASYKELLGKYAETKTDFLVIESLRNSPDLEWESIDYEKPNTWVNWRKELKESDFTEIEISRVLVGVMRANSLDESMIDEARSDFLHGQQGSEKLT